MGVVEFASNLGTSKATLGELISKMVDGNDLRSFSRLIEYFDLQEKILDVSGAFLSAPKQKVKKRLTLLAREPELTNIISVT